MERSPGLEGDTGGPAAHVAMLYEWSQSWEQAAAWCSRKTLVPAYKACQPAWRFWSPMYTVQGRSHGLLGSLAWTVRATTIKMKSRLDSPATPHVKTHACACTPQKNPGYPGNTFWIWNALERGRKTHQWLRWISVQSHKWSYFIEIRLKYLNSL